MAEVSAIPILYETYDDGSQGERTTAASSRLGSPGSPGRVVHGG